MDVAMMTGTQRWFAQGEAGQIECLIDWPTLSAELTVPKGWALIAHPHPLFGGTADNKVVTTLSRACTQLGFVAVRPNFRGVGATAGAHDEGNGEARDLEAVVRQLREHWANQLKWSADLPSCLAGFSFGTFVASTLLQTVWLDGQLPKAVVFVGTAASRFKVAQAPAHTLVVHGEQDETVPLQSAFDWARPQQLAVVVLPGADHFFHKRLTQLKTIVQDYLLRVL